MREFLARLPNFGKNKDKGNTSFREREAYLIGYPKSGNTWLRVMLGKYVQLLVGRAEKLPLPLFDRFEDLDPRVPLMQVTHGPLEWSHQTAADLTLENIVLPYHHSSVVLLVRNIPDILVSLYWQEKTRSNPPYEGSISNFICDPVWGVEKAVAFYRTWDQGKSMVRNLMLLRYEDLRYNTQDAFRGLLEFLHIPVAEEYLNTAVTYSEFANMRKLELKNLKSRELVYQSSGYSIFATGDIDKTPEAFHVRKGQIGGFREYLSGMDIEFLRNAMRGRMPAWYGYEDGFWQDDRS